MKNIKRGISIIIIFIIAINLSGCKTKEVGTSQGGQEEQHLTDISENEAFEKLFEQNPIDADLKENLERKGNQTDANQLERYTYYTKIWEDEIKSVYEILVKNSNNDFVQAVKQTQANWKNNRQQKLGEIQEKSKNDLDKSIKNYSYYREQAKSLYRYYYNIQPDYSYGYQSSSDTQVQTSSAIDGSVNEYGTASLGNIVNGGYATAQGDGVYFCGNFGIMRMDKDGNNLKQITETVTDGGLNVVGDWLYYNNGAFSKVKTDGTGYKIINKDVPYFLNVVGEWAYYTIENGGIVKVRTDGSERQVIHEGKTGVLIVQEGWIFYTEDNKIYKMTVEGENVTEIGKGGASLNLVGDTLYYSSCTYNPTKGKFYSVKTDGSDYRSGVLMSSFTNDQRYDESYLNVTENAFYCINGFNNATILKNGEEELNKQFSTNINIAGGWIFYFSRPNEAWSMDTIYYMKEDGSQATSYENNI